MRIPEPGWDLRPISVQEFNEPSFTVDTTGLVPVWTEWTTAAISFVPEDTFAVVNACDTELTAPAPAAFDTD